MEEDQRCMVAKALKRGKLSRERYGDVQAPRHDVFIDSLFPDFGVSTTVEGFLAFDCLLDFPAGEEEEKDSVNAPNVSGACSSLSSELAVPDDDIAELEWVSHFLDDDIAELECDINPSLLVPSDTEATEGEVNLFEPGHVSPDLDLFPSRVPAKLRNKRPRPTGASRTWSSGGPPVESSSLSSAASPSLSTPDLILSGGLVQPLDSGSSSDEPVAKKPKKGQPGRTSVGETGLAQFQRRCTHCQVQQTPQWRAGPLGPKTLCNACGVRYKSGRLFPEYRPACSPTFSSEVHSNSHRKVLEMRRRKEMGESARFSHMIRSY